MIAQIDLSGVQTETRNQNSINIDQVDTIELCQIINQEDRQTTLAVEKCLPVIASAIDGLVARVKEGGRVFYVGAGTSGRLGVLDASELPPTYSADPEQFIALIAGGNAALRHAQEGAEDDVEQAVRDLQAQRLDGDKDALIGIAASGRTPYVLSCLQYAKLLGCVTVGVACSSPSAMLKAGTVDFMIEAVTGSEIVTGSTRMKAGTATKMILNMLSTGVMIRTGKTYGNMMVDLKATNLKLEQRARNILRQLCGSLCPTDDRQLDELLKSCDGSVKLAIAVLSLKLSVVEAKEALEKAGGVLAVALNNASSSKSTLNPPKSTANNSGMVLFVDGGASKCAASIVTADGTLATGVAGGCNVTEIGPEAATNLIMSATKQALSRVGIKDPEDLRVVTFDKVWIGLAGYDRPYIASEMDKLIKGNFLVARADGLRISNDIDLIATVAAREAGTDTAIVLTAGTGSIVMSYAKISNGFQRVGRVGGYGHLLGDEGSAFDIGRRGIQYALDEITTPNVERLSDASTQQLSYLTQSILKHFSEQISKEGDLLSAVVRSPAMESSGEDAKWRITNTARLVLEAATVDEHAAAIVNGAAASLAGLVARIVALSHNDSSQGVLVLTGGLMRDDHFRELANAEILKKGCSFRNIAHFLQPSEQGAKLLAEIDA